MRTAIWNNNRAFNLHRGSFSYTLSKRQYDSIAQSRDTDMFKPAMPLIPVPVKAV
jgi:hypothetical protein